MFSDVVLFYERRSTSGLALGRLSWPDIYLFASLGAERNAAACHFYPRHFCGGVRGDLKYGAVVRHFIVQRGDDHSGEGMNDDRTLQDIERFESLLDRIVPWWIRRRIAFILVRRRLGKGASH